MSEPANTGDDGTIEPTPEPTPTPTTLSPDQVALSGMPDFQSWRNSLDPELRDQPSIANIESFEGLVREHANVQRFIGSDKITKPGNDASEEDWTRFYGAMGRPDKSDGYDLSEFATPENLPWDTAYQDRMVGVLHKNGVTQRQILGILNDTATGEGEVHAASLTQAQTHQSETMTTLQNKWGGAFPANTETARRAFEKTFGDAHERIANAVLDGVPIGDNPEFMEAFYKLGRGMVETGMIGAASKVTPVMTPSEAKARIAAFESDPEFQKLLVDPNQSSNPKVIEWNQLYEIAEVVE